MKCPSCSTPLEPGARFCGVCGYRLEAQGQRTPAPSVPKPGQGTIKQSGGGAGGGTPKPAVSGARPGANVVPRAAAPVPETQYRAQTPAAGNPVAVRAPIPAAGSGPKPKPAI